MYAIITFPEGFVDDTLGVASTIVSDLSPYLTLVLGLLLGVLVISFLIRALHR